MRFCGLSIADPLPSTSCSSGSTGRSRMRAICRCRGGSSMRAWWRHRDSATRTRRRRLEAGKTAAEIWPDEPAKAAQKATDARWTVKTSKGEVEADGTIKRDLAIPEFGYESHIDIDNRHGFSRRQKVTDAAAHDGARRREGLIDPTNTAFDALQGLLGRVSSGDRSDGLLTSDGPTPPTGRRPTRTCWPIAANAARFTVANTPASRCRSAPPERTPRSPPSGRRSSTSSPSSSSG